MEETETLRAASQDELRSAPSSAGRLFRFLCLGLLLYTLLTTAWMLVSVFQKTSDHWIACFMSCPLAMPTLLAAMALDTDAILALPVLLALAPLPGWCLAAAGKRAGFWIVRSCMIVELLLGVLVLMLGFAAGPFLPEVLLPTLLNLLIPALTLITLRAWQDRIRLK